MISWGRRNLSISLGNMKILKISRSNQKSRQSKKAYNYGRFWKKKRRESQMCHESSTPQKNHHGDFPTVVFLHKKTHETWLSINREIITKTFGNYKTCGTSTRNIAPSTTNSPCSTFRNTKAIAIPPSPKHALTSIAQQIAIIKERWLFYFILKKNF